MFSGVGRLSLSCLVLGAILVCVGPAVGADLLSSSLKPGDTVSVAAPSAQLFRGTDVVAVLPKGQQIVVHEVRDAWVGTQVTVGGQVQSGWIQVSDFVPVISSAGPGAVAIQPVAATPAYTACVYCECLLDDFLIGKYLRHEPEPNIHVWEPWRH